MKFIIGLSVIIPAVYTFLKYKPRRKDTLDIFLLNLLFGILVMVSTMSFDTAATALLSLGIIAALAVMNFCFYLEISREIRRRKRRAARVNIRKTGKNANVCSPKNIQFVA